MIEEEINRAKRLYESYGEALSNEDGLWELCERYRKAIVKTQEVMEEVGVVKTCSVCAREGTGSCCFQGVEEWYDHILLLMNFVFGIRTPDSREIAGSCFFVGSKGCKLFARHSFCVNYLCPNLKHLLETSHMETLLSVSGNELFCGWELEQSIHRWLRQQDGVGSPSGEQSLW